MNKKIIVLDIICYAAIPYLIWTHGREPLGDYIALLLSTMPGIIYTIYRFINERHFNIAGLFILGSLLISTSVNLVSASAESMLWNQVYLGFGFALIYFISIVIKKPLVLYFAVDFAYLQGHKREHSKALFNVKSLFKWFQLLTIVFVLRGVFQSLFKAWLLQTHGVDGYSQMLIWLNFSGYVFTGIIFGGYLFVTVKINHYLQGHNQKEDLERQGKTSI